MQITLEPTDEIVSIEGSPCRLWQGKDTNGTPVHAFVRAVSPQTHDADKLSAFEAELKALPSLGPGVIDYRFFED